MRMACLSLLVGMTLLASCEHFRPQAADPPFSYYHAPQFQWGGVARVVVLPLDNETAFPHAAEEVRNALVTEWQRMGLFEVVPAPADVAVEPSHVIRENGRFNEAALVRLARLYRADVVVLGAITQYSPYTLPRLGLVLQVVSPGDAAVVASVDGVWDAANFLVTQRARGFCKQYTGTHDEMLAPELILESPRLFQRFVCFEAANVLVNSSCPLQPSKVKAALESIGH
jgi:hypothetical protein